MSRVLLDAELFSSIDLSKRTVVIDADTLLFQAAVCQQKTTYLVTHIPTGNGGWFVENKKQFKEWLETEEAEGFSEEDYSLTPVVTLHGEISYACHAFKQRVEEIIRNTNADDFRICIQGTDNFRKQRDAKYVRYKANRTGDKPLLLKELADWVKVKYKEKCVVSQGEESDDVVTRFSAFFLRNAKSRDQYKAVIAFVDKDIAANHIGWSYNYNKPEDGIWWNSKKAMQYNHCMMVLTGDAADNVTGLGKLSPEIIEKYGLRSTKGVGKVSAEAILSGAETEKERWERIIEAYKASWPEDGMERLEEMNWFMWLRRTENEDFCLDKYLKKIGITQGLK